MTILKVKNIQRRNGEPYLWRLIVFRCRFFGVYLHHFLASDDECFHSHPWLFCSLILRGGYWETIGEHWTETLDGPRFVHTPKRWHRAGSILFRPAETAHRIEVPPGGRTWSIVLTGRRVRPWGFFTKFGWIPWQKYSHEEHCT